VAGFIGGPWVGLVTGILAAIEIFLRGGFFLWPTTLGVVLAGLFSGLYAHFKKKDKLVGAAEAVYFTVAYEMFAAGLTFLIVPDFKQALNMEGAIRLPLAIGNGVMVSMYMLITNNLCEERKMHIALKRLDRLHLVGQMAAGISHEIRNPMTTVRGYLQYFSSKEQLKPFAPQLNLMIEELDRANHIISEYLSLAKNKSINKKLANLTDIIQHIFCLLESDARLAGKFISLQLQNVPSLLLDEKEIRQLIFNLVLNGLEAMPAGGTVTIYTYVEEGHVVLAVQDEGCGIPHEMISQIGIPFITNKERGTGLGLAVCYNIAERHGAEILFDTSATGTTFYLFAPC